jgi:hypothetical protein
MALEVIHVRAVIAGPHRIEMMSVESGTQVGTMNTRPHHAPSLSPEEITKRVQMYCDLSNAMHPHFHFTPTRGPQP